MLLGMEIVSFPECGWKEGRREEGREGGGRMEGMGVAFRLDYLIESE